MTFELDLTEELPSFKYEISNDVRSIIDNIVEANAEIARKRMQKQAVTDRLTRVGQATFIALLEAPKGLTGADIMSHMEEIEIPHSLRRFRKYLLTDKKYRLKRRKDLYVLDIIR